MIILQENEEKFILRERAEFDVWSLMIIYCTKESTASILSTSPNPYYEINFHELFIFIFIFYEGAI